MTHRRSQCPRSSQEHNGQWSACPRAVPPPSCSRPLKTPCGKQGLCGRPCAPPPVKSVSRRAISGPSATSSSPRPSVSILSSQTAWLHPAHFCAHTHKSAPSRCASSLARPRSGQRSVSPRILHKRSNDGWCHTDTQYLRFIGRARLARHAGRVAPRFT
jgi:hypothetical protein